MINNEDKAKWEKEKEKCSSFSFSFFLTQFLDT